MACCLTCGRIFEALVKEACKRNNLKFQGLARGIEKLKDNGILKGHYKQFFEVSKYYRDKVSHPTSEVFNKEKAKWFLSTLLIFVEELF